VKCEVTDQIELELSYPYQNTVHIDFKAFVPETTETDQTFNLNIKCTLILQLNEVQKPILQSRSQSRISRSPIPPSTETATTTTSPSHQVAVPVRGDPVGPSKQSSSRFDPDCDLEDQDAVF